MSIQLTGNDLAGLVEDNVIKNGSIESVEGVKYDLHLDDWFIKNEHNGPKKISDFNSNENEKTCIAPGETVFVRTLEKLNMPMTLKAELSHKRKLAHEGIQLVGGFCVDPGYQGHLFFGMHNFSSEVFSLSIGKKLIAIQFYKLEGNELKDFPKPQPVEDYPDELRFIAPRMKAVSIQAVSDSLRDLENKFTTLKELVDSRDIWFEKLEKNIDEITDFMDRLERNLDNEMKVRRRDDEQSQKRLDTYQANIQLLERETNKIKIYVEFVKWFSVLVLGVVITQLIHTYFFTQ